MIVYPVRDAVMIAVATWAAVVGAVAMAPAATVEFPTVVTLRPDWTGVSVARADAFPMTLGPHVAAAVPVPVTRRPLVTTACGWHDFMARRWRLGMDHDHVTAPAAEAVTGRKAALLMAMATAAAERMLFIIASPDWFSDFTIACAGSKWRTGIILLQRIHLATFDAERITQPRMVSRSVLAQCGPLAAKCAIIWSSGIGRANR